MREEGASESLEYCVLRCPHCRNIFRHVLSAQTFGKPVKNRMCIVCGAKVPVDDMHCLDRDPMNGEYDAEFTSADNID